MSTPDGETGEENVATIDHAEVHVDLSKRTHGSQEPHGQTSPQTETKIDTSQAVTYSNSSSNVNVVPIVAQKPDPSRKPKDFINFSCVVIFAFNFIFGLIAWRYGLKSSDAWQLGDEPQARRHAKKAFMFCVIGIIVGVATYILAFTLFFTVGPPSRS